jgi:hypothetical protein
MAKKTTRKVTASKKRTTKKTGTPFLLSKGFGHLTIPNDVRVVVPDQVSAAIEAERATEE